MRVKSKPCLQAPERSQNDKMQATCASDLSPAQQLITRSVCWNLHSVLHRDGGAYLSKPVWANDPVPANDTAVYPVAQARNREAILGTFCSHTCDVPSNVESCRWTPNCVFGASPFPHGVGPGHCVSCLDREGHWSPNWSPLSDVPMVSPRGS